MAATDRFRVYGIRHHGPGSARRLLDSLEEWQPDLLLIEGPADAQSVIDQLQDPDMEPPVALVLYHEKNIDQASFLPFASFSPEYQAIRWGLRQQIGVELIDLPAKNYLVQENNEQLDLFQAGGDQVQDQVMIARLRRDPLSLLAELAGYEDSERWWDATLERTEGDQETFERLLQLISDLRTTYPKAIDTMTFRREAHMRLALRKALKGQHNRIAVIVGAWHGPALAELKRYPVKTDREQLKGLAKIKVAAAWVPWSYPRLARESGYGAGVKSPAWYELLFEHPDSATERWMVAAAQLLREESFAASPAQAADGVQLAKSLAQLREHQYPGLPELQQAALSSLAGGAAERLQIIQQQLSLGKRVGSVPKSASTIPLLANLQQELKATRLSKLWETTGEHYLRATKAQPRGGIDLRKSNQLRISHLLHRLNILQVRWGRLQPLGPNSLGSFKEIWLLEWQPELNLLLLERSSYGNTIAQAAAQFALEKSRTTLQIEQLANLVWDVLRADLGQVIEELLQQFRRRATQSKDIKSLLSSLPTLITTCRYGDSRKTDTSALLLLIEEMLPRITAGLSAAANQIDDEQAEQLTQAISKGNYAIAQLELAPLNQLWQDGLQRLAQNPNAHPLPKGLAWRLLFDQKLFDLTQTEQAFHLAMSAGQQAHYIAYWVAGFFRASGQLLLHYTPLRSLISDWLSQLQWEEFEQILPLLRRTFSDFRPGERQELLALLRSVVSKLDTAPVETRLTEPRLLPDQEQLMLSLRDWMGEN